MEMETQEAVQKLTEAGCVVEPAAVDRLTGDHVERITSLSPTPMVVNRTLIDNLENQIVDAPATSVELHTDIETEKEKRDIQDFVDFYNDRYAKIKDLLLRRRDIQSAVSLSRVSDLEERDDVSVVGIVNEKYKASTGRFIVYIEDPTGSAKILVDEDDGEHIVQDEVVGINGSVGDDIIFADDVIWPDVPLPSGVATTTEEVAAAFISDIHFGSIDTLDPVADAFVDWLNGDDPAARKVRYLFVVGDAVEGVGTYPGQEDELEVTSIYKQYERFEAFVEKIRDDVEIIIAPGNHDLVRLAEPQPPLPREALPAIYDNDNVHLVPNPARLTIHGHDSGGIDVLLYHGYSFDGHVNALQHLRNRAYAEPEHCMIDWLKRRHLAPIYGSNLVVPDDEDPLVIEEVPDIFAMGHTHSFACTTYKGVNLVCAGTFQGQTEFQKRVGHKPDPGKVAVIDLHTREAVVKQFVEDDADE